MRDNIKKGILAGLEDIEEVSSLQVKDIDINLIDTNPNNLYSISNIEDLAQDIEENGLYHPILVRLINNCYGNNRYEIISGERRYQAIKKLGWSKVPCIIKENVSDLDSEIMLIQANAKTRELTDMEKARQIKRLEELYKAKKEKGEYIQGKIRDKIGQDMGLSGVQVHRYKKLNDLIPELQELVDNGTLPMSTAEHFADMTIDEQKVIFEALKNKGVEIGRNEAKEIKDRLSRAEDNEKRLAILEDKLKSKEQELESFKEQFQKDIQAKDEQLKAQQEIINKLQNNIDSKENELINLKNELNNRTINAEKLRDEIKAELERTLQLANNEENNKAIDELKAKLIEAENNIKLIKDEYEEKILEKEIEIERLKEENDMLIDDYEKRLKEKQHKEINQKTIELNMEILALCNQANTLLKTIVNKIAHCNTIEGFKMSDEVKNAIASIVKTANINL